MDMDATAIRIPCRIPGMGHEYKEGYPIKILGTLRRLSRIRIGG